MAERGAYLTGTATYGKATIFEIVAQESLSSTLEPAFKKIFSVCFFALKSPFFIPRNLFKLLFIFLDLIYLFVNIINRFLLLVISRDMAGC